MILIMENENMLDNKNKDMLDDKLFLEDENNLETGFLL